MIGIMNSVPRVIQMIAESIKWSCSLLFIDFIGLLIVSDAELRVKW